MSKTEQECKNIIAKILNILDEEELNYSEMWSVLANITGSFLAATIKAGFTKKDKKELLKEYMSNVKQCLDAKIKSSIGVDV